MEPTLITKVFRVQGMSCPSCELKIENVLTEMTGVKEVKASLAKASVAVKYDPAETDPESIKSAVRKLGYEVDRDAFTDGKTGSNGAKKMSLNQILGVGIIIFAVYFVIKSTVGFNFIPQVEKSAGYGMLFVVGLLTSLHCIAMCGGINLSQCVRICDPVVKETGTVAEDAPQNLRAPGEAGRESQFAKFKPSFLYNLGRVISYTLIGGFAGALGSVISFSGGAKGVVAIIGGLFMVIIGIKMLDIFPWLRRFKISVPKFFGNKIYTNAGKHGPFIIGLLNGLMPCGPLQTMQLYALGTGSFLAGAGSMFLFSMGTVPLMFGFGALSSLLSSKFTQRMLKVSAALIIALGLMMVSRGLSLSGVSLAATSPFAGNTGNGVQNQAVAKIQGGIQEVTTAIESGRYQPIIVQQGIPVRWTIKAQAGDLNGCNNPVTIPKYNIQKRLVPGANVIEFTPQEAGTIIYTCWMGMITSQIKVVPDLARVSQEDLNQINKINNSGGLNDSSTSKGVSTGGGGCCAAGANATKFAGGRIPAGRIAIARFVNGVQEATVTVNDEGYSPAVVILQKGTNAIIRFNAEKLNSCNYIVTFPEYRGQLDLSQGQLATPELPVIQDFTFQCWMGMLHGYVKVVDDINTIDLNAVRKEVEAYRPTGGGGCCGG
ncbi:MAG: sulfite exporter TauE/SafE family protein [Firmicutes bacterium]|nr:sulfite exporter TauE/SafE family protein [Bacillota bacterium]